MTELKCSWASESNPNGKPLVWGSENPARRCFAANNTDPCDARCTEWRNKGVYPGCWQEAPPHLKKELGSMENMTNSPNFTWWCQRIYDRK